MLMCDILEKGTLIDLIGNLTPLLNYVWFIKYY